MVSPLLLMFFLLLWFPVVACAAVDPSVVAVLSVVDVLESCCFFISAVAATHSDGDVFSAIGVPKIFGVPAVAGVHAVVSINFIITKPLAFLWRTLTQHASIFFRAH
jgi:hypothetical protein